MIEISLHTTISHIIFITLHYHYFCLLCKSNKKKRETFDNNDFFHYFCAMKQEQDIKLSVVIPVYNKQEYLETCMKSVFAQDLKGIEAIAVDDGSTDGSGAVLDHLAYSFPSLRVIHTTNGGVTAARRTGVEAARGRYVTFVDPDDKVVEHGLDKLYNAIVSTGADEVVGTYRTQHGVTVSTGITGEADTTWMMRQLLASKARFCVLWAVIFKKELLEGCLSAPRTIRSGEDILMQILCLVKRPKVVFIDDVVYEYTVGLPNDRRQNLDEQRAYDAHLRDGLAPVWDEMKDYFLLRQLKQYENFIAAGEFHVLNDYFRPLRRQLSSRIPLADRIALLLPPCLAYIPIKLRKFGHIS